ncbi:MAG: class I SAM-dependent methyltransferase [Limnochordia bacterium]|jgi:tellurite methyltransferase
MKPSPGVALWAPFFHQLKIKRVLDLGAGNLRNSLYLRQLGYRVLAADLPGQLAKLTLPPGLDGLVTLGLLDQSRLQVDLILCTYVFNILTSPQRKALLRQVSSNLKPGGFLFLELRRKGPHARLNSFSGGELWGLLEPWGFRPWAASWGFRWLVTLFKQEGRPRW